MSDLVDFERLIACTTAVSLSAQKSVDGEDYFLSTDADSVTSEIILDRCLQRMVEDLQEIGVSVESQLGDIFRNWGSADELIETFGMLLPLSLARELRNDKILRTSVKNILDGNLGFNQATVLSFLEYIGMYDEHRAIQHGWAADVIKEHVSSSEVFDIYLTNLLREAEDASVSINDEERRKLFIKDVLEPFSTRARNAIFRLSKSMISEAEVDKLTRRLSTYLHTLSQDDQIDRHAWMHNTRTAPGECTDQEKALLDTYQKELERSSNLYPSWYIITDSNILPLDLLSILVRVYAETSSRDEVRKMYTYLSQDEQINMPHMMHLPIDRVVAAISPEDVGHG